VEERKEKLAQKKSQLKKLKKIAWRRQPQRIDIRTHKRVTNNKVEKEGDGSKYRYQ
jgi:hypothetical protein